MKIKGKECRERKGGREEDRKMRPKGKGREREEEREVRPDGKGKEGRKRGRYVRK